MRIHMNLDHHEPANGDFVAMIEAMVGSPPEDPELSGKEISARLKARSEYNRQLAEKGATDFDAGGIGSPPDIGDALQSIARTGLRTLFAMIAGILILTGIALFVILVMMPGTIPGLEPQYAAGAFFAGLILRSFAS